MFERKNQINQILLQNGQRRKDQEKIEAKAAYCTKEILKTKTGYIIRMVIELNDPNTAPKSYPSLLNRFLYSKKIPTIPPFINSKFISEFYSKVNQFKDYFASLYIPINNDININN